MLLAECDKSGVELLCGQTTGDVDHVDGLFRLALADREVEAPALVIATGGPSIPKMGATGYAYDLARRFGLKVVEPRPALAQTSIEPSLERTGARLRVSGSVSCTGSPDRPIA